MNLYLRRSLATLVVGIMVACCAVALAQEKDPAYGTWKLNAAKSQFSPGPAYKEMMVTIEPAGAGRKVSVTGTAADGTPVKWGYSGNFDGKDIRVTGNNPDADVVMLKRVSANAVRTTFKKNGKRTVVNGVSVSPDGKTLTVATNGVNAKGQTVKNKMVLDRQ
jgi:hypothetical protein